MVTRLQPLGEDIWIVTAQGSMPGGVRLPLRMTVVRLPDGDLWLHSAVPIDDALQAELAALGEVAHVVVPNLFHNLSAATAMGQFPAAQLHAPTGLRAKFVSSDTMRPAPRQADGI